MLAGNEVLATAVLDRLLHRRHVLDISGRSDWLRELDRAATANRGPNRRSPPCSPASDGQARSAGGSGPVTSTPSGEHPPPSRERATLLAGVEPSPREETGATGSGHPA